MSSLSSGGTRTYLERIQEALGAIERDYSEDTDQWIVLVEDVEKVQDLIHEMLKDVV